MAEIIGYNKHQGKIVLDENTEQELLKKLGGKK